MKSFGIAAIIVALLISLSSACAAEPDVKLVGTDSNGMKFTMEIVYPSDENSRNYNMIFYKNSDPSNKIYGKGTDLGRGFFYVNTDTPLFDMAFPKGNYSQFQPFKKILFVYYEKNDYFVSPKETIDPSLRIPYVVGSKKGQKEKAAHATGTELIFSDFPLQGMSYYTLAEMLKKKGFSENENPQTGEIVFKKGETEVSYSEDFDDDGGGSRCISITLPSFDDGWKFIKPLQDDAEWRMKRAPMGETYTSANGKIKIYHECNIVEFQISE